MGISERFSRQAFDDAEDVEALCRELEVEVRARLARSANVHVSFYELVEELRLSAMTCGPGTSRAT